MSHVRRLPDNSIYLDIIHVFGAWGIKNGSLLLCESEEVHVYVCYHSKQHPQVNASGPERDILVFFWGGGGLSLHPVSTKHLYDISTMSDQRRRRWTDIVQMLYKYFVFAGHSLPARLGSCQWQCYNIQALTNNDALTQCWLNISQASSTLAQYLTNIGSTSRVSRDGITSKHCIILSLSIHFVKISSVESMTFIQYTRGIPSPTTCLTLI